MQWLRGGGDGDGGDGRMLYSPLLFFNLDAVSIWIISLVGALEEGDMVAELAAEQK